jgi:hypothetical protein
MMIGDPQSFLVVGGGDVCGEHGVHGVLGSFPGGSSPL